MQINHVLVLASDVAAMRRFFVEVIGLEDGSRPPFRFPGHWLYSEGRPLIHLASADAGEAQNAYLGRRNPGASGAIDHLALCGADLPAFLARLERAAIVPQVRQVPLEQMTQIFVHGPEGIRIEMQFPQLEFTTTAPELTT